GEDLEDRWPSPPRCASLASRVDGASGMRAPGRAPARAHHLRRRRIDPGAGLRGAAEVVDEAAEGRRIVEIEGRAGGPRLAALAARATGPRAAGEQGDRVGGVVVLDLAAEDGELVPIGAGGRGVDEDAGEGAL